MRHIVNDMTIGIIVNEDKDIGLAVARQLSDAIHMRGGTAIAASALKQGMFANNFASLDGCDILVCIGGDGTLIKAARETIFLGAPIFGVNLGSLGYLTEVEATQIDVMLDRIFNHDYHIEERMMLTIIREPSGGGYRSIGGYRDGGGYHNGSSYIRGGDYGSHHNYDINGVGCTMTETAFNELSIGRGAEPHIIRLKVYINETFLDVYPGDGLLISTPTGSTAYSLSAGGPVIDPELSAISIVPVCPHVIFSRPVLIAPEKEITIVPVGAGASAGGGGGGIYGDSDGDSGGGSGGDGGNAGSLSSPGAVGGAGTGNFRAYVSVDGFRCPDLREGEVIRVRRSEHVTKMLRFNADNFYDVLKNKLFETSGKFGTDKMFQGAPMNG